MAHWTRWVSIKWYFEEWYHFQMNILSILVRFSCSKSPYMFSQVGISFCLKVTWSIYLWLTWSVYRLNALWFFLIKLSVTNQSISMYSNSHTQVKQHTLHSSHRDLKETDAILTNLKGHSNWDAIINTVVVADFRTNRQLFVTMDIADESRWWPAHDLLCELKPPTKILQSLCSHYNQEGFLSQDLYTSYMSRSKNPIHCQISQNFFSFFWVIHLMKNTS